MEEASARGHGPAAWIFDIYRGTTHDGPGMRSTVFFQGCPLRCGWCHNPEGLEAPRRVWWEARGCIGCGLCREACPSGAVREDGDGLHVDAGACTRCGACAAACPSGAMGFISREYAVDELAKEAARDKAFYDATGGGVTASGGECLTQAAAVAGLFESLRREGIHTALDTSGAVPYGAFEAVLPHTDLVLYDIKLFDGTAHRAHTGADSRRVLDNLARLAGELAGGRWPAGLWVRTPLVPGATATAENLSAIGAYIARTLRGTVSRWELCAFNNSCAAKYRRLRQPWPYEQTPLLRRDEAEFLLAAARRAADGALAAEDVVLTGLLAD